MGKISILSWLCLLSRQAGREVALSVANQLLCHSNDVRGRHVLIKVWQPPAVETGGCHDMMGKPCSVS